MNMRISSSLLLGSILGVLPALQAQTTTTANKDIFNPSIASAGSIVIGQINPPGLTAGGITGITFDGAANPLVIDGFGRTIWRLNLHDASVISTFPLTTEEVNTRSLDFDVTTGRYFTSRRFAAGDYLSTVDPHSRIVTDLGVMGSFNFLDMAINPRTGDLWLVNDCANIACTLAGGGSLWTVDKLTGTATPVQTFGTSLGQLTALAISPEGRFFVASSSSIYEIDPITGQSTLVTNTGLAPLSLFTDMAFDPSTNRLYGIEQRRGSTPNAWYLDEVTGLLQSVQILIKPGAAPPVPINAASKGKIPVAILSTSTFDAVANVDPSSLTFGHNGDEQSLAFCDTAGEDVNGDGLPDLVCHFRTRLAGFQSGDTVGILRGKTVQGVPILGQEPIVIVP